MTKKNVAGWRFEWNTAYEIMVYRNGEFFYIEDAFNGGLLSKEDVAAIKAEHDAFKSAYQNGR